MENKYFTPDIEDIRVGYECEKEDSIKGYEPYTFDLKGVRDAIQDEISDYREAWFRTPYLTKEQIEAEGWRCIHWREYLWEKGNKTIHFFNGQKEDNDDSTYLSIFTIHNSSKVLFEGECKDINTFRYICKLLNIK